MIPDPNVWHDRARIGSIHPVGRGWVPVCAQQCGGILGRLPAQTSEDAARKALIAHHDQQHGGRS